MGLKVEGKRKGNETKIRRIEPLEEQKMKRRKRRTEEA